MSVFSSRWPTSCDDFCPRFDSTKPYPFYSPPESATADAPSSPGGSRASTPPPSPPPPSSEWTTISSFDEYNGKISTVRVALSPAFRHPATPSPPSSEWSTISSFDQYNTDVPTVAQSRAFWHPAKADMEKTPTLDDEIAPRPSTPYIERTCKRKMREEVPQQHDASALREDAKQKAQAATGRARTAAQRVSKMDVVVRTLGNVLVLAKAEKNRAVAIAAALEGAVSNASDALGLARTELSATKKRLEGYSRPRRVLNFIMAKWETEPRQEVEEAASRVDEAARVDSSARAEVCTAWAVACKGVEKVDIATSRLRRAVRARANAKQVCMALEAAADCAAERARRAVDAVEAGRSWEQVIYQARGTGGRMDPLLALSGFAVNFERGLGSHEVIPNTKRVRY